MLLEYTLLIGFGGAFLVYLLGKISRWLRNFLTLLFSLTLVILVSLLYRTPHLELTYFSFLNYPLILRIDWFSWFFGIALVSINLLAIFFSLSYMKGKERLELFYMLMLLVNASMLGVVLSGDLISFYIYWEIMSWSTFLLLSYKEEGWKAGLKYIVLSIIGSFAMLVGMMVIYSQLGTFNINAIMKQMHLLSPTFTFSILFLFSIAFGIKNALMPLHTWLPDSYTEAESPFSVILSGMLTRMGVYGFILILYIIIGLKEFLLIGSGWFSQVLSYLAAISIILGTFIALLQDDAKKLLAWHSIGQGGYIILGLAYGTTLGVASGIFHTLNHAIYIALLFMVVGAVEFRTGCRDLNALGGLRSRMPVIFFGSLIGISGFIGVPLTNGFVSKWLLYKTLILNHSPFLAFSALIGTWGTILYGFKFLHNIFLGQIPAKYENVQKAPRSMQFPVILLSLAIILFGVLPGIPLAVIGWMQTTMGFEVANINIWGIVTETGTLNTVNIFFAIMLAILGIYLLSRIGFRARKVPQEDTYAAGHFTPRDKYAYTVEFYAPLTNLIKPIFREWVSIFYSKVVRVGRALSNTVRKIYVGDLGTYVLYIVMFLACLLILRMGWKIW